MQELRQTSTGSIPERLKASKGDELCQSEPALPLWWLWRVFYGFLHGSSSFELANHIWLIWWYEIEVQAEVQAQGSPVLRWFRLPDSLAFKTRHSVDVAVLQEILSHRHRSCQNDRPLARQYASCRMRRDPRREGFSHVLVRTVLLGKCKCLTMMLNGRMDSSCSCLCAALGMKPEAIMAIWSVRRLRRLLWVYYPLLYLIFSQYDSLNSHRSKKKVTGLRRNRRNRCHLCPSSKFRISCWI